jgi:hypothetical protein
MYLSTNSLNYFFWAAVYPFDMLTFLAFFFFVWAFTDSDRLDLEADLLDLAYSLRLSGLEADRVDFFDLIDFRDSTDYLAGD